VAGWPGTDCHACDKLVVVLRAYTEPGVAIQARLTYCQVI